MRTIIGILLALFGTLGTIAGFYLMGTKSIAMMDGEEQVAPEVLIASAANGLMLTLISLIAMYLSIAPKEVGSKAKKKRVDTH